MDKNPMHSSALMKFIKYTLLHIALFPFFLRSVFAQSGRDEPGSGRSPNVIEFKPPIEDKNLLCFIDRIADVFAFQIAPVIVVTMILFGAFRMLTAAGNPESFTVGKKTIVYAVLGYVVVLIIASVVNIGELFNDIFGGDLEVPVCGN